MTGGGCGGNGARGPGRRTALQLGATAALGVTAPTAGRTDVLELVRRHRPDGGWADEVADLRALVAEA